MPPPEKPFSTVKFSEWRPIGVCDEGKPNERKAVIFNEKELALVTAPGVDRETWQDYPKIIKLIHRCARKIAKMSALTKSMARPDVSAIKLVGMVLQYQKTPTLSMESEKGKVQMFQIGFVDRGQRKPWFGKVILATVGILVLAVGILYLMDANFLIEKRTSKVRCGEKRSSPRYAVHLDKTREQIATYLRRLPSTYRQSCYFTRGSISHREVQVVHCFLMLKTASPPLQPNPQVALKSAGQCVARICGKEIPALQSYCRQLNF